MNSLVLLTAPNCHLCDHARQVLDALVAERGIAWREVQTDSCEGRRLASTAPPLRPVLFTTDGHILGYGRLSAKRLRRALDATKVELPCTAASG
jgi:glutaredoxin